VNRIEAQIVSLHVGIEHGVIRDVESINVALDGVAGDRFQSYTRTTWAGDKQPQGTLRRNERQWSAVSQEELDAITEEMGLTEPLTGNALSVNLCCRGVANLSALPKGTLLKFPSGAELIVVEYNPPCREQGVRIAERYVTTSGKPPLPTAFPKAAKLCRGIVGVVDVPGAISVGDRFTVDVYAPPAWLQR
jgi:hypothetical protein